MQNRRDFLKQASLLLAGGLVAPQLFSSCNAQGSGKYIGLQLYSLREMVKDDGIQAVLEAVAKMGYKNLETADGGKFYGMTAVELKKRMDDLGLKCTSAHIGGPAYSKEKEAEIMTWWDKAIEGHNELGVKYMVCPSMHVDANTTLDDIKRMCDYFNTIGYKTAAAGIAFGYHNHAFEFRKIEDQLIYDYMLKNVSKNHVFFQLDVYWCQEGGYDPVEYLKKYADQIRTIHIKDEKEIGASGKMNFQPIFEQMKANNIKDWYVEVEKYTNNNAVESVQQSIDYLKAAEYVY
ncbi:sugar phosphate isomerase/epimerase [Parabacteroides sp. OttesenSCG-928-G06]|nr:sugar phosphate isomerase/epimerase [Parabacteroides sp. OttesenSCG-928-G06]